MSELGFQINPQIAVWEYTLQCNSSCIHCGSDANKKRKNELSKNECFSLVSDLSSLGFRKIILSGGEPTLRKDWFLTSEKIREYGMELGIISNTLLWDDDFFLKLKYLNPFSVGISIEGSEKIHDYLRGVRGSFKKAFSAAKNLKKHDITICAITSLNSMNYSDLKLIRSNLEEYGFDAWQVQLASPMGRMKAHTELMLNSDQHYGLGRFLCETRELLPEMNVCAGDCIGYFGSLEKKLRDSSWKGCMAGIVGVGIESDGTIKGCLSMQADFAKEGNIRKESLSSIWNNPDNFKYNRNFSSNNLKGMCCGCLKGNECRGGCQSQSLAFFNEFHHSPYCFLNYEQSQAK